MVFLLSFVGYLYFYGDNHAPYREFKTFLGQTFDRYIGSTLETSSQTQDEIATQQSNIAGTEAQALDFAAQKASFENQIDQLKSRNEALAADLAELIGVREKIAELEGLRKTLKHLVRACRGDHRPDCPILDDLSDGSEERYN